MPARTPVRALVLPRLALQPLEDRTTPAVAYALSGTNLLSFDTASPAVTQTTAITGVSAGDTLVGIDFRPQNGLLYGLGVNATANTATLYAISTRAGVAAPVGTPGAITFTDVGGNTTDLPDPAAVGYGVDFNPAADRVRVVAGALNFRVNPNTGAPIDGNGDGSAANPGNGTNPDGPINGQTPTVDATAYTNNQANNGNLTTQYTLDSASDRLYIQTPPNFGTQVNPGGSSVAITLGGNPLDFTAVGGFDIPAGVNVTTSGQPVTAGSGFAVLTVGGTTGLYSINLVTGAATFVGNVGAVATAVRGFAVQSDLGGFPAVALTGDGTQLVRFNTATPGTITSLVITGVNFGETLVGLDYRPATGQLYGLGVNATADTATLYLIDPQTAALTTVGTPGQIAFVTVGGVAIDLPSPSAGYGFDFNPTVDRLRVTTGTGLNFRVNPNNGAGIDADGGAANGVNPDGLINGGGAVGVTATAYTNSFGTGGSPVAPAGVTTQYTLDAITGSLFVQNPPNSGTQTRARTITLGNTPLGFTSVSGFDIPAGVAVEASGSFFPGGRGYATLTAGGVTRLYVLDLSTGEATDLGAVGAGTTDLAGLALGDAPAGTIAFGSATFTVQEFGFGVTFSLVRTSSVGNATVTVTPVANGTASANEISLFPITFTFADGQTTVTNLVSPILDDVLDEPNETFTLTLSNPTGGAAIGALNAVTVTILDDDLPPSPPPAPNPPPPNPPAPTPPPPATTRPKFVAGGGGGLTTAQPDGSRSTVNPFGRFAGEVRVATGDVNGDGVADTVASAGPGGGPHVKVFDGKSGAELLSFFAFDRAFAGGVNVAAGDVNGDGTVDVVVAAGPGGGPHVKAFDGKSGAELLSFFAYDRAFGGGLTVATGDVDGDGRADIVTAAGPGGNGHVKVFSGSDRSESRSFFAYPGRTFGAFVASGDLDGDGRAEIVTGAGPGGGPHVKVFDGEDGRVLTSFFAYNPGFTGGVRVAVNNAGQILAGAGPGGGPHVKVFDPLGTELEATFADDPNFLGGVFVG